MTDGGDHRRGAGRRRRRGARPSAARRRAPPGRADRLGRLRRADGRPNCPRSCGSTPGSPRPGAPSSPATRWPRRWRRDPLFRQRIAEKLREAQPELTGALDSGAPPPAADPLDVAAAAYVLRPTGLGEAGRPPRARRPCGRTPSAPTRRRRAELERLREELAEARGQTRTETERLRTELESAKKEAESLHRKLRGALSDVKRGEAAVRKLHGEMEAVRGRGAGPGVRRRERDAGGSRRGSARSRRPWRPPAGRPARAAASRTCAYGCCSTPCWTPTQGLRRELALPPVSVRPAETVDAVEPGRMTPKDIAARALSENDPAILDQLLALPQAHLVVDGYNVTKTGYPQMPLEKQRLRLLGQLSQLAAQTGAEVTCVFDGAELAAPGAARAAARGAGAVLQAGCHGGRVDPPAGARRAAGAAGHRRLHRPRGGRRGGQGGCAARWPRRCS